MGNVADREMMFESSSSTELIGNENSEGAGHVTWNQTHLKFHPVHGCNIILQRDGVIARRNESFCHGLAFSNRPIAVDEVVCIRFAEVGQSWSGFLRFGVTNIDPTSYREGELPKFACPDLTTKVGYWAKALPERYSQQGALLHFYVNNLGELHYGINGVVKGVFIQNINVNLPVWVIVDIYGNCKSLEFVDVTEVQFRNRRRNNDTRNDSIVPILPDSSSEPTLPSSMPISSPTSPLSFLRTPCVPPPHSLYYPGAQLSRAAFHSTHGRNVRVNAAGTVATRREAEYSNGYVFVSVPMKTDESILLKILDVEHAYSGSIAFGLTSCDPARISFNEFPDDSDDLLERPEYWVGIKDVSAGPKIGDELKFCVNSAGHVLFSKNGSTERVIIHVDTSVPLWMYFDLYGSTREVRLMGSFMRNESVPNVTALPLTAIPNLRIALPDLSRRVDRRMPTSVTTSGQLRVDLPPSAVYSRSNSERPPDSARRSGYRVALPNNNSVPSRMADIAGPSSSSVSREPSIDYRDRDYRDRPRFHSTVDPPLLSSLLGTDMFPSLSLPLPRPPAPSTSTSTPSSTTRLNHPLSFDPPMPPAPPTGVSAAEGSTSVTTPDSDGTAGEAQSDCIICMSNQVNTVIYRCGHMCLCFSCAQTVLSRSRKCPMCRSDITDIIRCFKN
uniref:Neuralized n=1 Tax=Steinernema glaseri TaxID=37863 RepID=A0A1I7Z3Z0_9BILA